MSSRSRSVHPDPDRPPVAKRRRCLLPVTATLVASGLLAASACTSGRDASPSPTTVSTDAPTPTGTTPPATAPTSAATLPASTTTAAAATKWTSEQQAVVDAYLAMNRSFEAASLVNDANAPELQTHAAGALLIAMETQLDQYKRIGFILKARAHSIGRIDVEEVTITGDKSLLWACEVSDAVVYRVKDASVVNDKVVTHRWAVEFTRQAGQWKAVTADGPQWDGEAWAECVETFK